MIIEHDNIINCAQEGTLAAITKTLDRMERSQEKVVDLLEKVANQEGKITNLLDHTERNFRSINELFARVRGLEVNAASTVPEMKQHVHDTLDALNDKLGKLDTFFRLTTSKPAILAYSSIIGMIVLGTFCDVMYHFETIKAFLAIVRG